MHIWFWTEIVHRQQSLEDIEAIHEIHDRS